jgi:hypothetical protein
LTTLALQIEAVGSGPAIEVVVLQFFRTRPGEKPSSPMPVLIGQLNNHCRDLSTAKVSFRRFVNKTNFFFSLPSESCENESRVTRSQSYDF